MINEHRRVRILTRNIYPWVNFTNTCRVIW